MLDKNFIEKQVKKLEKELEEGFADFEEPSDSSFTPTNMALYNKEKVRKNLKSKSKKKKK